MQVSFLEDGSGFSCNGILSTTAVAWKDVWCISRMDQLGGGVAPRVIGFNYKLLLTNGESIKLPYNLVGIDDLIKKILENAAPSEPPHAVAKFISPSASQGLWFIHSDFARQVIDSDLSLPDCRHCPSCGGSERLPAPEYPPSPDNEVVVCGRCGVRYRCPSIRNLLGMLAISGVSGAIAANIILSRDPIRGLSFGGLVACGLFGLLCTGFLIFAGFTAKRFFSKP